MRAWKGSKFVKNREDLQNLEKLIGRNMQFLKAEHICMMSRSTFPATTMNQFTVFSKKAKFLDKRVNQARLDTFFKQVNTDGGEEPQGGDNPDNSLVRYEFIELLARIAQEKYQKTGEAETVTEAFSMLIERNLLQIAEAE